MFFPRLRRQARWMFVFLALVFGGGFVIFGVGSNLPSGLGDILQDVSFDNSPSVGDARDRVRENPQSAEAYRELASALQQNQRPDEAMAPLEKYLKLRPRDESALRELAGLYTSKSSRLESDLNLAALEVQEATTGSLVTPGQEVQSLFQGGAIEQAVQADATESYQNLAAQVGEFAQKAQRTYTRLIRVQPNEPQLHLLLASSAERAGDIQAAIDAYRRFLKVAPEDSSAPSVKRAIRQLERELRSQSTTVTPLGGGG